MSQSVAMGARSKYSAQIAAAICWELTEGKSLRAICKQEGMPAFQTVFSWIDSNERFREQYTRARAIQAHSVAEEAMEIVDEVKGGTSEEIQSARLRFDARRWMAGKLLPKVYGDKMLHTGADGEGPIQHKLALDYGRFNPQQKAQFLALLEIAMGPQDGGAPMIEGEATEETE